MAQGRNGPFSHLFAPAAGGAVERDRLALLQQRIRDAHTTRCLDAIGVGDGWCCLDVGAGAGSIAAWLGDRVGPSGRVVATELDTEALAHLDTPNLDVLCHDIVVDDLPRDAFDLVHTRFVLNQLSERDDVVKRLIAAARPGSWIVIGDQDLDAVAPTRPNDVFVRIWEALMATMTQAGVDIGYGARIPGILEDHGLADVQANGESTYWRGGSLAAQL